MNKTREIVATTMFSLAGLLSQVHAEPNTTRAVKEFRDCPACPEMVVIPAGSFEMGSIDGLVNELPVHRVTISRPFAMGKNEVTQAQWREIMGNNPSHFQRCGDSCPVEQVNWDDVQKFITKLTIRTGKQYYLPSESEWEYACRAGEKQKYCGSDQINIVAWYGANASPIGSSGKSTNPVGLKKANAFGLYDMSGNVWEWVADNYHASYQGAPSNGRAWYGKDKARVLRGGAWDDEKEFSRSTVRYRKEALFRNNYDGFRLARVLP